MMRTQKSSELFHKKFPQEATLTKHVKNYLDSLPNVQWYKASDRYHKGVSDIIACVEGKYVAIELKAENGKPSPHQLLYIKQVRSAGGVGGVCYSVDDVAKLIKEAKGH